MDGSTYDDKADPAHFEPISLESAMNIDFIDSTIGMDGDALMKLLGPIEDLQDDPILGIVPEH